MQGIGPKAKDFSNPDDDPDCNHCFHPRTQTRRRQRVRRVRLPLLGVRVPLSALGPIAGPVAGYGSALGSLQVQTVSEGKDRPAGPTGPAAGGLYRLPGTTEDPHPTCGRPKRGASCQTVYEAGQSKLGVFSSDARSHVRRVVVMTCGRPGCPRCYEAWASRAAGRVEERMQECIRIAKENRIPGSGGIKHWAWSPPPELVAELVDQGADVEKVLREKLRAIASANGFVGGVDIFHPWRTKANGAGKYRKGQNYFSPHFHVVGVGHLTNSDVIHRQTGWVVKNLGVRSSVRATIAYLLDHAGVRKRLNGKTTSIPRWSGSMSTRRIILEKETVEFEAQTCDCGALLVEHPLDARGEVEWETMLGNAYWQVRRRRFRLAKARCPNG